MLRKEGGWKVESGRVSLEAFENWRIGELENWRIRELRLETGDFLLAAADDEEQARFDFDGGGIGCHFVADAA